MARRAPSTRGQAPRRKGPRAGALTRRRLARADFAGGDGRQLDRSLRTCLALVRSRTGGSRRGPHPAALGWKLENGILAEAQLAALCAAIRGELARAGGSPRWAAPAALRALLVEYRSVRDVFLQHAAARPVRARRVRRPADCA